MTVKCVHANDCAVDWCYHRSAHPLMSGICDTKCQNGDKPREAHCDPIEAIKEPCEGCKDFERDTPKTSCYFAKPGKCDKWDRSLAYQAGLAQGRQEMGKEIRGHFHLLLETSFSAKSIDHALWARTEMDAWLESYLEERAKNG